MSFVHCCLWLKKKTLHASESYVVAEQLRQRLKRVDPRDGAHRRAVASCYSGRSNWTSPVRGEHETHVRTVGGRVDTGTSQTEPEAC